jgi:hypothetical protein
MLVQDEGFSFKTASMKNGKSKKLSLLKKDFADATEK